MGPQYKPITITSRMPKNVARVARIFNALKLSSDPINKCTLTPGGGVRLGIARTQLFVSELEKSLGSIKGARIVDIGCGEVMETKETGVLKCLVEMGMPPSLYQGIDPSISERYSGLHKTKTGCARYLPLSLFELDESTLSSIGKTDFVISSMFLGDPLTMSALNLRMKFMKALNSMPKFIYINNPNQASSSVINPLHGNNSEKGYCMTDFLEFLIHDFCRKIIDSQGKIAHYILSGEEEPNIEIANAAGLKLIEKKELEDRGTLFCFAPHSNITSS
jgi:hypothetical protein